MSERGKGKPAASGDIFAKKGGGKKKVSGAHLPPCQRGKKQHDINKSPPWCSQGGGGEGFVRIFLSSHSRTFGGEKEREGEKGGGGKETEFSEQVKFLGKKAFLFSGGGGGGGEGERAKRGIEGRRKGDFFF